MNISLPDGFLAFYVNGIIVFFTILLSLIVGYLLIDTLVEILTGIYSIICSIFKRKNEPDFQNTNSSTINSTLIEISKQAVTLTNTVDELSKKLKRLESIRNIKQHSTKNLRNYI